MEKEKDAYNERRRFSELQRIYGCLLSQPTNGTSVGPKWHRRPFRIFRKKKRIFIFSYFPRVALSQKAKHEREAARRLGERNKLRTDYGVFRASWGERPRDSDSNSDTH